MIKKNIADFQTPFGQKGNLLSPKNWLSSIFGVLFLVIVIVFGLWLGGGVINRFKTITPAIPDSLRAIIPAGSRIV